MTTIITVHGTNAGDPSDRGEQWWQQDSEFQRNLAELIEPEDGTLEFEPFHWSGANSEHDRRNAGNRLRRRLAQQDSSDEVTAVIGHSHGGSVLNHALFSAYSKKEPLPALRAWMTIGTPYLHFIRSPNFLSRVNILGQMAYLAIFTFSIITLGEIWELFDTFIFFTSGDGELVRLAIESLPAILVNIIGSLLFLAIIFAFTRRARKRNSKSHQQLFEESFHGRWISLVDKDDEAVAGLRVAKDLNAKIVGFHTVRRSFVSLAILGSLAALIYGLLTESIPSNVLLSQLLPGSAFTSTTNEGLAISAAVYDPKRDALVIDYGRSHRAAGLAVLRKPFQRTAQEDGESLEFDVFIPYSGSGQCLKGLLDPTLSRFIVFCPYTREVKIWDVHSGVLVSSFHTPGYQSGEARRYRGTRLGRGGIARFNISADRLIIETNLAQLELWDVELGSKITTIDKGNEVDFDNTGKRVIVERENSFEIYDSKSGDLIKSVNGTDVGRPFGLEASIIYYRDDDLLHVLNTHTGRTLVSIDWMAAVSEFQENSSGTFSTFASRALKFDRSGRRLGLIGDKGVFLFNLEEPISSLEEAIVFDGKYEGALFLPDGRRALLRLPNDKYVLVDSQSGEDGIVLTGNIREMLWKPGEHSLTSVLRTRNGREEILLVKNNGDVVAYDMETGREVFFAPAYRNNMGAESVTTFAAFASDKKTVLIAHIFDRWTSHYHEARDEAGERISSLFSGPTNSRFVWASPINSMKYRDGDTFASGSYFFLYGKAASIWTPHAGARGRVSFDLRLEPLQQNYLEKYTSGQVEASIWSEDRPSLWEWPIFFYTAFYFNVQELLESEINEYRENLERLERDLPELRAELARKQAELAEGPALVASGEVTEDDFLINQEDVENVVALLNQKEEEYSYLLANRPLTETLRPLLINLMGFVLFFFVAAFAWVTSNAIAFAILLPATWALNRFLGTQIKNIFIGNDVYGESIRDVTDNVARQSVAGWQPLPKALSDEITQYTEQFAFDALRKLRQLLGTISAGAQNGSLENALENQLTWKELIHTAYFDVGNFVKLVAVSLCEAGVVRPSAVLRNDPEYETVCRWHAELKQAAPPS